MNKIFINGNFNCDNLLALYFVKKANLDVVGIGSSYGSVSLEDSNYNLNNLINYLKLDLNYSVGASKAIINHNVKFRNDLIDLNNGKDNYNGKYVWDDLYHLSEKDKLAVISYGPLTNIAISLLKYPNLKERIERIIILGGAITKGDITGYAEHDIYYDPYSFNIVTKRDIPITLITMDTYLSCDLDKDIIDKLNDGNNKELFDLYFKYDDVKKDNLDLRNELSLASLVYLKELKDFKLSKGKNEKYLVKELLPLIYLKNKDVFIARNEYVVAETKGNNYGQTIVDFRKQLKKNANAEVGLELDKKLFIKELLNW